MVVNLQDADLARPGQLAAGHQGEDMDTATQSALAGTLVSSLHRLKDVDNTGEPVKNSFPPKGFPLIFS